MISELLTIVIPTRDRPDLLESCLRSVFEGQGEAVPHVIVSDNSVRDYADEIEALARRYPFEYVRQSGDLSMFDHHAAFLDLPKTRWTFILHDDDEVRPGVLGRLESVLADTDDVGAVIGGIEFINDDGTKRGVWRPDLTGKHKGEEIVLHLGLDYRVCPPGILWNLSACREVGGFHNSNGTPNEQVLVLQIAYSHGVLLVPEIIGRYRLWDGQTTDFSTIEAADYNLENTIQGAHAMRDIGVSAEASDRLIDYMIWWVFRYVTPLFRKHPFAVSRLCRKCELASPPDGEWRNRVKQEYPVLFWKPRRLSILCVSAGLVLVPGPIRRALGRVGRAGHRVLENLRSKALLDTGK